MNYLKLGIVAAVLGAMFWLGTIRGDVKAFKANERANRAESNAKIARDALVQAMGVIEQERAKAKAANAVAEQYEKDKKHAEANAARLAADLRAGRARLQERWTCPVSASSPSAGQPDAGADDRAESASRIVAAADAADAQIRALQDFIREAWK